MKGRLWLCLAVSLLGHALFFPDLLQAMMASGATGKEPRAPKRVNIKLVPRPAQPKVAIVKPPTPKVRVPEPRKVKPPVAKTPPPAQRKPAARPKPTVAPKANVRPEPVRPVAVQPRPTTSPPRAGGRPPRSTRRLSGTTPPRGSKPTAAVPMPSSPGEPQGQAGVIPTQPGLPDVPIDDGDGDGGEAPPGPPPSEPVGAAPPPPAQETPKPAQPRPQPPPEPEQPKPSPAPQPTPRSASATPKLREASIEVPTIKLPANLRRDSLKASLQVRVVIEADGRVDFKLGDTSGNPDVDDYVLEQLRKVAHVTTALDDQGQPKRTMKRVRVDIEVD